jgi:hypothetical protein
MLKSVVAPEVASLSIGIFLFTVNVDYAVALKTTAIIIEELKLKSNSSEYGNTLFYLCAIPAGAAIPLFFFAGLSAKR